MIRVLICDDHMIVRRGIRQSLAEAADIAVVAEAADGPLALRQLRELREGGVDVLLLDIALPGRDGLDVLRQVRAEHPRLPVLMLSTYPDRQYAVRSLKLGASGYLNKSVDSEQITAAVRRVAGGQRFITPPVAELLAHALGAARSDGAEAVPEELLSHREFQVFRLLASGQSVGEIARKLSLSSNTVSTYRARILDKTGVRNDVELALYAVRRADGASSLN
jgi:two-component system, NarL family, invasion response regulator UvrY